MSVNVSIVDLDENTYALNVACGAPVAVFKQPIVELEISPGRVYPSSDRGAKARPRKGAESCHSASNSQHANPQRRKAIYYSVTEGGLS